MFRNENFILIGRMLKLIVKKAAPMSINSANSEAFFYSEFNFTVPGK